MSVPTKTAFEIRKDLEQDKILGGNLWMLLSDHQKDKIESNDLMYKAGITDAKKLMVKEGWLSPEQIFEILQKEYNSGGITPVQLRILRDVFGVGGAKPK